MLINKNDEVYEDSLDDVQLEYKKLLLNKINQGEYKLEDVKECICGSSEFLLVSKRERFNLDFSAYICNKCGLILTSPRLREDKIKDFYNDIYSGLTFGKNRKDKIYQTSREAERGRFEFLSKFLENDATSIVEIGCGSGHNLSKIKSYFCDNGINISVTGCEYSNENVNIAKEEFDIDVVCGGMEELESAGIKADLIILSHVFEHFFDLKKEMIILKNMLKENGMIYIEVPGVLDLVNKKEYNYDFRKYLTLAHNYNFSLQTLTNIMEIGGFELIDGDEYVHALYKLKKDNTTKPILINNYKIILEEINNLTRINEDYYKLTYLWKQKKYKLIIKEFSDSNKFESIYYVFKAFYELKCDDEVFKYGIEFLKQVKYYTNKKNNNSKINDLINQNNSVVNYLFSRMKTCDIEVYKKYIKTILNEANQNIIFRKGLFGLLYYLYNEKKYENILFLEGLKYCEVYFYIGRVYKDLGNLEESYENLNEYIILANNELEFNKELVIFNNEFKASAYFHIGEIFYKQENMAKAKKYFKECCVISQKKHIKSKEYLERL